jgi:hypothetical protein
MTITRFVAICLTLAALSMLASPSAAQHEIHHVPPFINPAGDNPDLLQPFIDPWTFDPDYQFFAPADFGNFGKDGPDPNTGFFATYDRLYIYVTRPEDQNAESFMPITPPPGTPYQVLDDPTGGDFTWGNRFDLGYMSDEDHGWLTTFWHIDGPNYYDEQALERVDVYEPDDDVNTDDTVVDLRGGGGGAATPGPRNPSVPTRDQNSPINGQRDFIVMNSINVADLSSWELNKTFRVHALNYGSIVEPFFGFRYMKFQDFYRRDRYQRWDPATGAPLPNQFPFVPPPVDVTPFFVEDMVTTQATFDNHMIGGQLGLRWYKHKDRWNLSSEVRAFAFQNFQSFDNVTNLERTFFTALAPDADIDTVIYDRTQSTGNDTEFVFGTEIRAEAAYAVTRDLSLRVGMAFMEFGRGIGRGNSLARNDQDVTMVGATFGLLFNR